MGRLTAEISFQRSDSDSETSCTGYAFLPSAGYRVLVFTTAVDCVNDLFAARLQMAISLGFHIIFAEIGIAMPLVMVTAEWRGSRGWNHRGRERGGVGGVRGDGECMDE